MPPPIGPEFVYAGTWSMKKTGGTKALDTLAREDPVKTEVVKLRYFVGLNHQETADALGISEPTVRRHWAVARVRLYELIARSPGT